MHVYNQLYNEYSYNEYADITLSVGRLDSEGEDWQQNL